MLRRRRARAEEKRRDARGDGGSRGEKIFEQKTQEGFQEAQEGLQEEAQEGLEEEAQEGEEESPRGLGERQR